MLKKYGENKNLGLENQDHFETKLKSFLNSQFFHIVFVICRRLLTMGKFMNKWITSIMLMFPLTSVAQYGYSAYGYANTGLQGSGYWGGQQNCGYQVSQNTGGKSQGQQKEKADSRLTELKKELAAKELDKKRSEKEMELAAKKLERVFDSEILDFLLEVHIEKGNTCADYKTFPGSRCGQQQVSQTGSTAVGEGTVSEDGSQVITPATQVVSTVDCDGKEDVPEKLQAKWTKQSGGYCNANSRSSGGSVSAAICSDASLRNSDRKSSASSSDCSKQLANYRKFRIKRDEAQAKIERIEDEIEDRQYAIADEKERASLDGQSRMAKTEADCEECGMMDRDGGGGEKKSNRDWISTLGNIGVGLGLAYVGKQYDDRNAEYSAQLGYPPQSGYPTAVSLGLPFILNGVYGSVNGSNGQGSMGCGNSMSMSGMTGMAGAFGYPQSMYGQNPYGGGMYTMGYNPYMNGYGNQNLYASNGYGMMANGMMNGYGTMMNGYGTMAGGMANYGYGNMSNYGTMSGYGNMSNYGLGTMNNNYQSQMLALQYQQQMSQYQMQYYQQQYQAQMQQYQQQQQVAQQGQQLQQEIYNLQMRLQNLYSGSYYNNGTSTSGLTATGGYYGTTTAPTWIPGSTSTIYTPTTVNGR